MPLGRFAAYFCFLVTIGLVAFPRAMGALPTPGVVAEVTAPPCAESRDCAPVDPSFGVSHRRTPPALRRRLEAGESVPLPDAFLMEPGRSRRLPHA